MRAAKFYGEGRIEVVELTDPRPGPGADSGRERTARFDMIDVTIHSMGGGTCSFSGKEATDEGSVR